MIDAAARALGLLPAEAAHRVTIRLAKVFLSLLPEARADDPRLGVDVLGIHFPNPIGLAAGFDKDAEVPDAMLRFGFGFVECGTVTPLAQAGNPRPRLFRLSEDRVSVRVRSNRCSSSRTCSPRRSGVLGEETLTVT